MARHPVTIEAVLANVQRGRVAYLVLTQEQKRLLPARPPSKRHRLVGTPAPVKPHNRLRWWQHLLFGDITGLPPPEIPRPRVARKSLDEGFQWPR
jgi:hypothetical protein